MDELNPTVREQEIYEEMELTPEMVKSIRTLCATCLRHFVEAKAFKIALCRAMTRAWTPARSARPGVATTTLSCTAEVRCFIHHRGGDTNPINNTTIIERSPLPRKAAGFLHIQTGGSQLESTWKFRRGDIYFIRLDSSVGSEQNGDRPAVIFKMMWAIPTHRL